MPRCVMRTILLGHRALGLRTRTPCPCCSLSWHQYGKGDPFIQECIVASVRCCQFVALTLWHMITNWLLIVSRNLGMCVAVLGL